MTTTKKRKRYTPPGMADREASFPAVAALRRRILDDLALPMKSRRGLWSSSPYPLEELNLWLWYGVRLRDADKAEQDLKARPRRSTRP